MGAEAFTVLAILDAKDRASEIFDRMTASVDRFSESSKGAAESVSMSAAKIDEALGRDVSAADRLDMADARVEASQARAAEAARALTDAENGLRDARAAAAGAADGDQAATDRLVEADRQLAGAQRDAALAARGLRDAEAQQVTAMRGAADAGDANAAAQLKVRDSAAESGIKLAAVGKIAGITAIGMGVAGALMVKAAGNFQDSTTHLVTDAGELPSKLGMIQAGILQVSDATGQSAELITQAMYHVESAGYHGAQGLAVLRVAAEGARVGGADLDTVSKTLVGTMKAYGLESKNTAVQQRMAAQVMNQLVAITGAGDMRMQDLASSLSAVTPVAAAAHISLAQVGGAIATMTSQGMSADQSTQDLANLIRSLQAPSAVASNEMRALGLNANTVSQNLGKTGLAGTLNVLRDAVLRNTQGGMVMLGYLNLMTPAAQGLAQGIMAGTISTGELTKATKQLSPEQAALVTKFRTAAVSATGLKQTFVGAMKAMTGGATGMNVALMLTGKHMGDLNRATSTIAAEARKGGTAVDNWGRIQATFNFKLSAAKVGIENTGIAIGSALLPAATTLLGVITAIVMPIAQWTASHRTATVVIFATVAALAALIAIISLAAKAWSAVTNAIKIVQATLRAVGLMSAEAGGEQVAAAGEAAAANEVAAATTEAGWIAANAAMMLGIGLLIVIVIAAVVLIITHWKQISAWAARVWHDVVSFVMDAVHTVVAFVRSHWQLLLAILTGPVSLATLFIRDHWRQIADAAGEAVGWVRSHWQLLLAILTGPIGVATLFIKDHWHQITAGAQSMLADLTSWFAALPGRILAVLGNLGHLLWNAGASIIEWFVAGMESQWHGVTGFVGGIAGWISSHKGPISADRVLLFPHGGAIMAGLADGLKAGLPKVTAQLRVATAAIAAGDGRAGGVAAGVAGVGLAASSPALAAHPHGGAGSGGITVVNDFRGAQIMSERDMDDLADKAGQAVTRALAAAGIHVHF